MYSKSFRRLKHKTQVFLQPEGDHYRTRMTHTLEVNRIARTIARALSLNEDSTGGRRPGPRPGPHPFGHAGERPLNSIMPGGFAHYQQSLRVVDRLEKEGEGLNLTWRYATASSATPGDSKPPPWRARWSAWPTRSPTSTTTLRTPSGAESSTPWTSPWPSLKFWASPTERINALVEDVITASRDQDAICQSPEVGEAMAALREFMFESVYTNPWPRARREKPRAATRAQYPPRLWPAASTGLTCPPVSSRKMSRQASEAGEQGRLGVSGQLEGFFRPLLAELYQVIAQNVAGVRVKTRGNREVADQVVAHADILGALSREYEHDLRVMTRHGVFLPS